MQKARAFFLVCAGLLFGAISAFAQVQPVGVAEPCMNDSRTYVVLSNGDVFARDRSVAGSTWQPACNMLAGEGGPDEHVVGLAAICADQGTRLYSMSSAGHLCVTEFGLQCGRWSTSIFETTGLTPEEVVAFGTNARFEGYAVTTGGNVFSISLYPTGGAVYQGNIFGTNPTLTTRSTIGQLKVIYR